MDKWGTGVKGNDRVALVWRLIRIEQTLQSLHSTMGEETYGSRNLRNARRQRSVVKSLAEVVNEAMENVSRRFACLSCAAMYEECDVRRRGPVIVKAILRSEGGRHILASAMCYPKLEIDIGREAVRHESVHASGLPSLSEGVEIEVNVCK